jgi:iron complex transport system substrate-binding protein
LRIVSLLPSATEIVCVLGRRESLVARSHECDWPEDVASLPAVTRPRLDVRGSSREIHERVTELARAAGGAYALDEEAIRSLAPTHVVTQAQCDVCAVGLGDVERALAGWPVRPAVTALHPSDLSAVIEDIRRTGMFLEAAARAERVIERMRARFDAVRRASGGGPRPRVACLEWTDPLMGAGNWIPELIRIAGGEPVLGIAGRHSDWISAEDLRRADPDVIVVIPCGFDLDRAAAELRALAGRPELADLRAMRTGRAFAADGNAYFNRPGPRLADSAEILGEIFAAAPSRRGAAWRSLEDVCGSS